MEIVPGLHQLKVPIPNNPLENLLAYLLKGTDSNTLIDTGWFTPGALDALERQLGELGVKVEQISHVVLTHIHPDHYGLAGKIKERSGAQIIMHAAEQPLIETRYRSPGGLLDSMADWLARYGVPEEDMLKLQRASMPVLSFVTVVEPDLTVQDGQVLRLEPWELEVIWTPGHSPGHICLYERTKKLLFSGDHVLPVITPNVSLNPQSGGNPLGDFIDSLRKLEHLEVAWVLPAHEYHFPDLGRRLKELYHHHDKRLGEILATIALSPQTGYHIASQVRWDVGPWEGMPPLMRRAALMETLSHVELLIRQGQVARTLVNGTFLFQRT